MSKTYIMLKFYSFLFLLVFVFVICLGKKRTSLSDEQVQEFLDAHNYFRRLVKAANMNILKYNETLADMAELWAKECKFKHGQPSSIRSPFEYVGQNIYIKSPQLDPNITHVTKMWYDENVNYTYENQVCHGMCEHYTQVVWADTIYIGCAIHNCTSMPPLRAKYITNVVCNYGPGGNFPGMEPYMEGDPCDMCSTDVCLDGLCDSDY